MYLFSDVWPVLWDGNIRLRGKVWFCETGTTTSKNIFDKDGNALVNPILTNADGRTDVQVILEGDYTAYFYRYIGTDALMDDADPDNWLLLYNELILEGGTSGSVTTSTNVETVAELKALSVSDAYFSVILLGYYAGGDKPAVTYTWYPLSTTDEDGGSVIASTTTVTGRWILTIPQIIDVRDFGVVPNTDTTTQSVYSSQLTACLTYAEKVKRSVKFSSINKTVGYSYYSFEGGSFNSTTQKILIDDNVFFIGKDNTATTLNFSLLEKNSKLLLNTAYTNGTLNLVCDTVKTSWRGVNYLTSTLSADHYIVDSNATIAGLDTAYVSISFDGTTGLSLTAEYCNFVDCINRNILNDTDGTLSITNCKNFRISYLTAKNLSYISTDATTTFILDDVLATLATLPASGTAYNFIQKNEGCLAAGYFDRHATEYKVSDYKSVWDALTNKVPVLDLEGKIQNVADIGSCTDPSTSPTIRKIINGTISGDTFSPEATFAYVLENLELQSDTSQWLKITAINCRFTGTAQYLYAGTNSSFTNTTFTNSDCTIAGLTDCTFDNCSVNPIVIVNNLHATNTTFNGAVTCGNSYITGGSFLSGITLDASYCATEVFTYMNIDGVDPSVNIVNKTVHAIKGFVQNAIIDGDLDILPSNASSTDYSSIVRGLDIGYNKITGDFTSSLSVGSDASRTHGFIREWVGSAGSLCSLETPNQFSIHDNVKLASVPTNFYEWIDGGSVTRYEPNWPLSNGILHQTNFRMVSTSATWEALVPVMNKYIFKLCNDFFDPVTTTGSITGQTYGSMTTNIYLTIADGESYTPLRHIADGASPGGYQGGVTAQAIHCLVVDAYPVIPALILEGT